MKTTTGSGRKLSRNLTYVSSTGSADWTGEVDQTALREKIERLLKSLEEQDTDDSLGTPELYETDTVRELAGLGSEAIPYFIEQLKTRPPKVVAYIVLALGKMGDAKVVQSLRELKATYQAREPKSEWEYAVIGQCNVALEALDAGC